MKYGFLLSIVMAFMLTACGVPPQTASTTTPSGVKVGKPYNVNGTTYYPAYDPHYDEVGIASWYGPGFHGGKTANGETYNQADFTAAHPTLPMPSLVRVTNESNGSSIIVRINDRGPFVPGRIIDLSQSSARALGITGTAKVRVQYLKQETEQYWAKSNLTTRDIQFSANDPAAPSEDMLEPEIAGDESQQVKTAAPVLSVDSTDLNPDQLQFRPRQPSFQVVGDAQAAEGFSNQQYNPQEVTSADNPTINRRAPTPPIASQNAPRVRPKVVKLVPLGKTPPTRTSPPIAAASPPVAAYAPEAAESPSAGGKAWYIQAGSFSSEKNADQLAGNLSTIASAETMSVMVHGKTWHRVRVGPFTDLATARAALPQAMEKGASGAWIVKE